MRIPCQAQGIRRGGLWRYASDQLSRGMLLGSTQAHIPPWVSAYGLGGSVTSDTRNTTASDADGVMPKCGCRLGVVQTLWRLLRKLTKDPRQDKGFGVVAWTSAVPTSKIPCACVPNNNNHNSSHNHNHNNTKQQQRHQPLYIFQLPITRLWRSYMLVVHSQ